MITPNIMKLIGDAMKAHDVVRVSTLRMLSSELKNEKINLQRDLTEEEELKVIRKEVKKRKEAIEILEKIKNTKTPEIQERVKTESEELKILQEFLPPEMSEAEIVKIVEDAIVEVKPTGVPDMGKVIGWVKQKAPSAEGQLIASLVRQKLSA